MYGPHGHHDKHYYRFYTILITIAIAGIFFLLLMNDGNDGITSLTIGDLEASGEGVTKEVVEETSLEEEFERDDKVAEVFTKEVQTNAKEVDLVLSFDKIPTVKKEARIKEMELTFDDLTTKIQVNNDKLELSDLKEVSLQIEGFVGDIDFNEEDFSAEGVAKSIEVNGVKLSTKEAIDISFEGLNYQSAIIEDIELVDLELSHGDGSLEVSEKLKYSLEQEELKIYYFNGRLAIQRDLDNVLDMEGVARGIMVSGALLNLNLR